MDKVPKDWGFRLVEKAKWRGRRPPLPPQAILDDAVRPPVSRPGLVELAQPPADPQSLKMGLLVSTRLFIGGFSLMIPAFPLATLSPALEARAPGLLRVARKILVGGLSRRSRFPTGSTGLRILLDMGPKTFKSPATLGIKRTLGSRKAQNMQDRA